MPSLPEPYRPILGEISHLLRLAVPVVLTQIGAMALTMVDVIMVGHVGADVLAAASLGSVWMMGTLIIGMGVILGLDPVITQAHGARDREILGLSLQRGIVVALGLSLPLACLWLATEPVMLLARQEPRLAAMAHDYVVVQIPSIPAYLSFLAQRQYLQGRGIVKPAMWITLGANGLNVLFNWGLIFGNLGMPALGLVGAGLATCMTRVFLALGLAAWMIAGRLHEGAWVAWSRKALDRAPLGALLALGLPIGFQLGLDVWAFEIVTLLAGQFDTASLAAHSIVLNLVALAFMIPLGISSAAVTRVGNLIGRGDARNARQATWIAIALGAAMMAACALAFIVFRHRIPLFYTGDARVIEVAGGLLIIAAMFQLFDGIQVVAGGILRAMKRTKTAAWFNLIGYYGLGLPLAIALAFGLDLRVEGLWYGLSAALAIIAASLTVWLWQHGPGVRLDTTPAAPVAGEP
ncbi:MAG TPA: MATE family efflux transporter [Haliangium sp.]|nr:MATE family efflux transporter [Haliangium sp.]